MGLTGVFYHPSFSRRSYLTLGNRLKDFPSAFEIFEGKNIAIFECKPVSVELVLSVHTEELLNYVRSDPLCSTAWLSAGGVVEASELVYAGSISNAFCYIGTGGHHAGRNYTWGYCCFNDVVLAIKSLRDKYRAVRAAIIDTDSHHGDGTRELVKDDVGVLHFCLCDQDFSDSAGHNYDRTFHRYFEALKGFCELARSFDPDIIFWYFGHDTHVGEYGDKGLTIEDYVKTAEYISDLASDVCDGKLVVVLGGGSDPEIARKSTTAIILVLSDRLT